MKNLRTALSALDAATVVFLAVAFVGCGAGANQNTAPGLPATVSQAAGVNDASALPKTRAPSGSHVRYIVKDLGTLRGPTSQLSPDGTTIFENARGNVVGFSDTPNYDPYASEENPLFPILDGYIQHAFLWRQGKLIDLGALPGTTISYAASVSNTNFATGLSTNGAIDPITNYIEGHAVLWGHDGLTDLGTLGGYESIGFQVNDRGDVAGAASNSIPNDYSYFGWGAQMRAFRWHGGAMYDLGTLGGSNSLAINVNASGEVAGLSDTSTIVNPKTGVPPEHPFLWEPTGNHGKGKMRDAGTIGGTLVYSLAGINERGQFVGQMSLSDEQTFHAFKWDGRKLVDLGTLGGPSSNPYGINEAGSVVGEADTPSGCSGPAPRGFLWRHGTMIDLGVTSGTGRSVAHGINAHDQVVGYSFTCDYTSSTAFLWEKGQLYDLNTLVAPSSMYLFFALEINDRGEISGDGLVNGETHAFVLIPCQDGRGPCADAGRTRGTSTPTQLPERIRNMLIHRNALHRVARKGIS